MTVKGLVTVTDKMFFFSVFLQKDSNPSAQLLLDIGETHIIVDMRGEHKLSKELGTPIPVLNFFLTLEKDIL